MSLPLTWNLRPIHLFNLLPRDVPPEVRTRGVGDGTQVFDLMQHTRSYAASLRQSLASGNAAGQGAPSANADVARGVAFAQAPQPTPF